MDELTDEQFDKFRKDVSPPAHSVLQALQYDLTQGLAAGAGVVSGNWATDIALNNSMQILKITMGAECFNTGTGQGRRLTAMSLYITPQAPTDNPVVTVPTKSQTVSGPVVIVENELSFRTSDQGLNLDFNQDSGLYLVAKPQLYTLRYEFICDTAFALNDTIFANLQIWLR